MTHPTCPALAVAAHATVGSLYIAANKDDPFCPPVALL